MSALIRRLRPATSVRLALSYVRGMTSHRLLVVGITLLCTASVLLSLMMQNDVSTGDVLEAAGVLVKDSSSPVASNRSSAVRHDVDRLPSRLFVNRPLILLTLSYHAAPIYDLMDQLQPLGVQFIERGINAYACRYLNTCRQDGLLEARSHSSYMLINFSNIMQMQMHAAVNVFDIGSFSWWNMFCGGFRICKWGQGRAP